MGFAGSFVENDQTRQGVWSGDGSGANTRLAVDGDPIGNLPSGTRLQSVDTLSVAADGSLFADVTYAGARPGVAVARIDETGITHVFGVDDPAPGLGDTAVLGLSEGFDEFLARYAHTTAGTLIAAPYRASPSATRNDYGLWMLDAGTLSLVTAGPDLAGVVYPRTDTGCTVTLFDGPVDLQVLRDGGFALHALLRGEGEVCRGRAILAIDGERIHVIARAGAPIPGSTGDIYDAFILVGPGNASDHLTVLASVRHDDDASSIPPYASARFLFERSADGDFVSRLVLLDNERFPIGDAPDLADEFARTGNWSVRPAADASVAVSAFDIVYGGLPHDGQPYPDLDNPGASPLRFVVSEVSAAPPGYPDTAVIGALSVDETRLGAFEADAGGATYFYARIDDTVAPEDARVLADGLWRADTNGVIAPHLLVGGELAVDGVVHVVTAIGEEGLDLERGLHANDDGSLYALADVREADAEGTPGDGRTVVLRLLPAAR